MHRNGFRFAVTMGFIGVLAQAIFTQGVNASQDLPTFFDLEKDGDGVISKDEAVDWSALTSVWESIDTNRDDQLDMREWNAFDPKMLSSQQEQKKTDDK